MTPDDADARRLLDLVTGSWMSQAARAAAELGIADLLRDGPRTSADLAAAAGLHAPSLHRLLGALASIEICRELPDGRFEITPMGALLGSGAEGSLRAWTLWWGEQLWPVWGNLPYSVKTGKSARALLQGTAGFDHLDRDPTAAARFHDALRELTRMAARDVVAAYDFSGLKRIVDVGGGHGELLAAILEAHPTSSGVLFDLPHAKEGARRRLANLPCEFVEGDFFHDLPGGGDAYLLKSVLHDWDDEKARSLLEVCRRAMDRTARLLVVEQVLPDRRESTPTHRSLSRSDLTMLVAHAARERTDAELRGLLESAGFEVRRAVAAGSTFSVFEAFPGPPTSRRAAGA